MDRLVGRVLELVLFLKQQSYSGAKRVLTLEEGESHPLGSKRGMVGSSHRRRDLSPLLALFCSPRSRHPMPGPNPHPGSGGRPLARMVLRGWVAVLGRILRQQRAAVPKCLMCICWVKAAWLIATLC